MMCAEVKLIEAVVHVFQILLRLMPVMLRRRAVIGGNLAFGDCPPGAGMRYVMP